MPPKPRRFQDAAGESQELPPCIHRMDQRGGGPCGNGGVLETRKAFYPRSEQREIRTEESFKNTQPPLRKVRGVRGLLADGGPSPARAAEGSQKKDVSCTAASPKLCQRARRNEHHQHCLGESTGRPGEPGRGGANACSAGPPWGIQFFTATACSISSGKGFFLMYVGKSQCAKENKKGELGPC